MGLILGADREHHLPRKMLALVYLQNLLHRVSHAQVMAQEVTDLSNLLNGQKWELESSCWREGLQCGKQGGED